MANIQEKIKGKKIVSFKIKVCVGRDENGKQVFRCTTWYPPEGLTNGKARKEVQKVAIVWEDQAKEAYRKELAEGKTVVAGLFRSFEFEKFVYEVWVPLCVRDGSHRPSTIAMYTNILKILVPKFEGMSIKEISGVHISQYLRWLRNDYRKQDGKPLAEKSINSGSAGFEGSGAFSAMVIFFSEPSSLGSQATNNGIIENKILTTGSYDLDRFFSVVFTNCANQVRFFLICISI